MYWSSDQYFVSNERRYGTNVVGNWLNDPTELDTWKNNSSLVGMPNTSESNALIPVKKLATSFLMYKIGKYNIPVS